jgi:CheY-like chemotaxis protein/anti-sigma regulatory factor (Ser/Thr protein kinase)
MTRHILAIDDEAPNLTMIEGFLEGEDYQVTCMSGAEAGITHLESGQKTDLILLDRMMPGMDGIAFLKHIKKDPRFSSIPVIMQTAANAPEDIAESIAAGAFYYLTKPYQSVVLNALVKSALRDFDSFESAAEQLRSIHSAFARLHYCRFSFQTLEDVANISLHLASMYPEPEAVLMGIKELMLNAVEHGNLGISYEEKSQLNSDNRWVDEVQRRLTLPENEKKVAYIEVVRSDDSLTLTIEDAGKGFDWNRYLDIDPTRAFDNHGRGIAMARMMSFDSMEYNAPGNKVVCHSALRSA